MQIPATLRTHLHALSQAIEDPDLSLTAAVRAVLSSWHDTVPSFLGVALIFAVHGHTTTISTLDHQLDPSAVGSSARIPLPTRKPNTGVDIIFYARTPGAFVDFSADAAHILQLPLDAIHIDQDLTPTSTTDPAQASMIHLATGILLDRGHTPETALPALESLAAAAGTTLLGAAQQLVASSQHAAGG